MHTTPHGVIHISNLRLRITGNDQRELRLKLKQILPHEARTDLVPAGQALHLGLVPLARRVDLLRVHKPSAHQRRQLCGVTLIVRRQENVRTGHGGIIAKDVS